MTDEWEDIAVGPSVPSAGGDEWEDVAFGPPASEWNLVGSAKNLLSGAVEGIGGLAGMAADLNPFGGVRSGPIVVDPTTGEARQLSPLDFPASRAIQEAISPYLAEEDPQYRYARTAGQFLGPSAGAKIASVGVKALTQAPKLVAALQTASKPVAIASEATSAIGAQAAEDWTGDDAIAPLVGAIGAGAVPSLVSGGVRGIGALVRGPTSREIKGSAAKALKEYTGLTADQVEAAMKKAPRDDLGALMTTAEVTDNAAMAQIEQQLAGSSGAAQKYNALNNARTDVREGILSGITEAQPVTPETLGGALRGAATTREMRMGVAANKAWAKVPRDIPIDVSKGQREVLGVLDSKQAGLPVGSKVATLVDQFANPEAGAVRSSGALQDIRSSVLDLSRDANLTGFEKRVLATLGSEIDRSMARNLPEGAYDAWKAARDATKAQKETFARRKVGGALLDENTIPANLLKRAFRGDAAGVQELKAAIGKRPQLLEQVKRGVLDSIPRDADGNLTANNMKRFLAANKPGLAALLGQGEVVRLERILDDLRSQSRVQKIATLASRGGSATAQRVGTAAAVRDAVLESFLPGSGVANRVMDEVSKAARTKASAQIEEAIFEAALNPAFAAELLKAPTAERVMSLTERIGQTLRDAAAMGGAMGAIEIARPDASAFEERSLREAPRLSREAGIGPGFPREQTGPRSQGQAGGLPQVRTEQRPQQRALDPRGNFQAPQRGEGVEGSGTGSRFPYQSNRPNPGSTPAPKANSGVSVDQVKAYAKQLPPLVQAVIAVESSFNPKAVSKAGAKGLMQLMPATAKAHGVQDPFDIEQNIKGGMAALNEELQRFGDVRLALAAYNAGSPRVLAAIRKAGSRNWMDVAPHLPAETRAYPGKVLGKYRGIAKV